MLTDTEYFVAAAATLDRIESQIDTWLQNDVIDIDAQRTGGLLELCFPNGSKIVLNTQPPLQELWLATRARGFHYRYDHGDWRDTRDNSGLLDTLSEHASQQAGCPLKF